LRKEGKTKIKRIVMKQQEITRILTQTSEILSREDSYKGLLHQQAGHTPLPSESNLKEIVSLSRAVIFPGYFGDSAVHSNTLLYHTGVNIERLFGLLVTEIYAALCFDDVTDELDKLNAMATELAVRFIETLPKLRKVMATDVEAAYLGDPAAKSFGEVISCYPVIRAICNYRIAHQLLMLDVPLLPRIITEMAHRETGIDIHPGAVIGSYFTIDHGTGVVIGETCIIGNHVKLYQGVTLGARSFDLDDNGLPIKGIERHPILEDDVIIYSNATILGRITIGRGAVVGGNIWVTEDVPAYGKITQSAARR
jgi:serine O-acetyltransferase